MNPNSKLIGRCFAAVLATILVSTSAFAGAKPNALPPTNVTLQNPSFEQQNIGMNMWTTNLVSGWNLLPGSTAGVWRPSATMFYGSPWDGKNVLYIDAGGVSQNLPGMNLQAMADYSFSMKWGNRLDTTGSYLALQLVAGGNVLASCTPPYSPAAGRTATVTLVYHSNGSSSAIGQPLSIRVVKVDQPSDNIPITWGTQVDADNAQVNFTDLTGTPAITFTSTQECSVTLAQ